MTRFVIDASAVLVALRQETEAARAAELVRGGSISAVNLVEVNSRMLMLGVRDSVVEEWVGLFELNVVALEIEVALAAARLAPLTQSAGLSLGDRVCLALGDHLRLPVLTADTAWKQAFLHQPIEYLR